MKNLSKLPDNLAQWLSYMESCHPENIAMGLERLKAVGEKEQLFQFHCPIITVAGTNGKGSTVASLAWLLKIAGLRVGTYTSPHLIHFKERIQIDGQCFTEQALCEAFAAIEAMRGDIQLTFFEFTTLAALYLFQQASMQLDVLILEVGMGGRLDAVNAIDPDIAIITAIGFDHQPWLGDTLAAIGEEKAGILRESIPVILSKDAALPGILAKAERLNNRVYLEGREFDFNEIQGTWDCASAKIPLGKFELPLNSVSLAFASYTILGEFYFTLPALSDIVAQLNGVGMIGRFLSFEWDDIQLIFDVAHNPQGTQWLANKIRAKGANQPQGRILAVWGSLEDKSLAELTHPMKDLVDCWYIAALDTKRAASVQAMHQVLEGCKVQCAPSILAAFQAALKSANSGDSIVIFGSFYTVAPILEALKFDDLTGQNQGLFHQQSTILQEPFVRLERLRNEVCIHG